MAISIKTQKDIIVTEASLDSNTDLNEVDQLMRLSRATGTVTATYNQGGRLGVNVKQNKRVPERVSEDVRRLVGITSKEIE